MTSQDDLGMLWYGVPGISYNNADPAEVMLNAGTAAPLLSDQPRGLITTQDPQLIQGINPCQSYTYGDPNTLAVHQNQMYYDPNSVECLNQGDSIYETYEGYDEESCAPKFIGPDGMHCIDGQMQSQEVTTEDEGSPQPKTNKKPKVHQNPALKLKTPIAYQRDTDPNEIPIMKEGMAICDRCGAIGVKHAFYGKDRKYCSLGCARGPLANSLLRKASFDDNRSLEDEQVKTEVVDVSEPPSETVSVATSIELHNGTTPNESNGPFLPSNNTPALISNESQSGSTDMAVDAGPSYKWETSYLWAVENFKAAPVQAFQHVPMSECWQLIGEGMKVEVSCKEDDSSNDAFWVATVISVSGYKAKLRFEGCLNDPSIDFWVDICSQEVHPVGWCATQGNALIPPKAIQHRYSDWKQFLMMRLTGARTLPTSFHAKILDSQKSRFRPGLDLEIVDKNRIAQMRVATVTAVIGKRLHLKYHGAPQHDSGFWCHEDSPLIHPVGWSREVGHEIVASQSYHEKCMEIKYNADDATQDLFIQPEMTQNKCKDLITVGMKLEALDPLNLSQICVASIMKVLANGYLMIKIDSYALDSTASDWFCYHQSSPYIFPCGFCDSNDICLTPPKGCNERFVYSAYLQQTHSLAMPSSAFKRTKTQMDFRKGMSLEAVDLMDPRLVCVAQVEEMKGNLLKIHFDGWESEFDQWVDCESPDIYPVGWCDLVKYNLEGPREDLVPVVSKRKVRGSKKVKVFRRGVENASPTTDAASIHGAAKKGRSKGRGNRGGYSGSSFHQPGHVEINTNDTSASIEERLQPTRGRRGRPRKIPLQNVNYPVRTLISSPPRTARSKGQFPNYEDGDGSDETSSGVASLAGSEVSNEYWDDDSSLFKVSNSPAVDFPSPPPPVSDDFISDRVKCAALTPLPNKPEIVVFDGISSFGQNSLGNILLEEDECKQPNENGTTETNLDPLCIIDDAMEHETFLADDCPSSSLSEAIADHHMLDDQIANVKIEPNLPRIIDVVPGTRTVNVQPSIWSSHDVASFLVNNDCGAYCQNFISQGVDGPSFLALTQNDLMSLTKMKVGPSIKIQALIQQLSAIVNPAQARYQATMLKKKSFS